MKSNSFKRIFVFLVVLCMTFCFAVCASAAEVDASASMTVSASLEGNTVTAVVKIDSNTAFRGAQAYLNYDSSKLTYAGATPGLISGTTFHDTGSAISIVAESATDVRSGTLGTFTFTVKDGATGNVSFSLDKISVSDPTGSERIPCTGGSDTIAAFTLSGANMSLGNNLSMNFFIAPENLDKDEDYYAVITMDYADDREDYVEIVVEDKWSWHEDTKLYYVTMDMVAAKEMTDEITVTIYNDEDEQVSVVWVDSVRAYAMRMLANETDKVMLPLYVEMLNYGAAAQEYFDYDERDLANKLLTTEQKAHGLGDVTLNSKDAEGENYAGMNLKLESSIIVNFFFNNIPANHDDMYAIATYIDHYGERQAVTVEGKDFGLYSGYWYVPVNKLVVADCRQLVSVKVYDASDDVIASVTDSVENYVGRMSTSDPLYESIMKFAVSAYNYLHALK